MKTTRRSLVSCLFTGVAALALTGTAAQPAHADASARAFLLPYVQWAQSQPNGPQNTYGVNFTMVSNRPSQQATYTNNFLPLAQFRPPNTPINVRTIGFSNSYLDMLYSTRLWYSSANGAYNPFNPMAPDKVSVSLDANAGTLILLGPTIGNARGIPITIDLKAQNGVLIGMTPNNGPTYVISVNRGYQGVIL